MTSNTSSQAFGLDKRISSPNPLLFESYDLRIGEPKISPFPFDIFNELHQEKNINCYYPSHGDPALRQMILEKYYRGFTLDNLAITHGTMGALDFILRASLEIGDEILIPDPAFPPYVKLAEFSRGTVKRYGLNLFGEHKTFIDWESVENLITDKTKILLINSPHNPTGKILMKEDVQNFERILDKYPQVSFILDEVYRELIYNGCTHFDFAPYVDRGYIVSSFSKMFPLQGARIGWILSNKHSMKKLALYFNNATGAMSSFGQEIGKAVLNRDISFAGHYVSALKQTKKILDSFKVEYVIPDGAFFIFIKYNRPGSGVVEELENLGVSTVPGIVFGNSGEDFIRVSFAQEESILVKAFSIIGQHWKQTVPKDLQ